MIDAVGIEQGAPALHAMNNVSFIEQEFGKVSTVLPGHTCYQSCFSHTVICDLPASPCWRERVKAGEGRFAIQSQLIFTKMVYMRGFHGISSALRSWESLRERTKR